MTIEPAAMTVVLVIMTVVVWQRRRKRSVPMPIPPRRRRAGSFGVGAGAAGTIYELLNQEKRNAIEIIVEEKAAYKDPEHVDGTSPDAAITNHKFNSSK